MKSLLSVRHHEIVQEVRSAMDKFVTPRLDEIERNAELPSEIYAYMAEAGWYGVSIPRSYAGRDDGHLARVLMIEEASRACGAVGGALQSAILGTAMIQYFGNATQKQVWLPRFATGTDMISICVTEPGSGSHILGMKTSARRDGNDYILNGTKCWIANSHIANIHGVIARTGEGSRGLTAFLVEGDRPGVRAGEKNDNAGLRGFNIGEVIFEDCRIPASNMIGLEGQGAQVAHRSITCYGKPNLSAVALGVHQAILDASVEYSRHREIYDKPLASLESARLKIGDIFRRVSIARQALYWAMHTLEQDGSADREIVLAKLVGTEDAFLSAKSALDLFAARGTSRDVPVERFMRDILMVFPPAGTSDVHRKRLAEMALGCYVPSSEAGADEFHHLRRV